MDEMEQGAGVGLASARAGMDRKTGRKYARTGLMPSETTTPRSWRTREDPFLNDWPAIEGMLVLAPELEAKTLFEHFSALAPGRYEAGQLRTLQRKVRQWRALSGPEKEVWFAQQHVAGEAAQVDFTSTGELGITVGGLPYRHLLGHFVLPYSNWSSLTPCQSESLIALSATVQQGVFRLGHVPEFLQIDNSSAATHDPRTGSRVFNDNYLALVRHLGMKPRKTAVNTPEQNGDVESLNGAMKRRLEQHLLLRGSRDFENLALYLAWLDDVSARSNGLRVARLNEELAVMRPLTAARLALSREFRVHVTRWSTINVQRNIYSVPSRLIGEIVRALAYDDRVEVLHGNDLQLVIPRLAGVEKHRIDYRHVVWSLVRKPGAFQRYKYREELFPTVTFRRAYDALLSVRNGRDADTEYLRILHLAASTMESDVDTALSILLDAGHALSCEATRTLIAPAVVEHPHLATLQPDLTEYDELLAEVSA